MFFFDEVDALCPKRGRGGEGGGISEQVVNQLLTEMGGLEARKNVFVVAATDWPELIDQAMLRPSRVDRLLYVPLPRIEQTPSLADDRQLVSMEVESFGGADLADLLREAGLDVLRHLKIRELLMGNGTYTDEENAREILAAEARSTADLKGETGSGAVRCCRTAISCARGL